MAGVKPTSVVRTKKKSEISSITRGTKRITGKIGRRKRLNLSEREIPFGRSFPCLIRIPLTDSPFYENRMILRCFQRDRNEFEASRTPPAC